MGASEIMTTNRVLVAEYVAALIRPSIPIFLAFFTDTGHTFLLGGRVGSEHECVMGFGILSSLSGIWIVSSQIEEAAQEKDCRLHK